MLEDDDEVAVVHGPAEIGYVSTSEPMVNIRATLGAAATKGILARSGGRWKAWPRAYFFGERSWRALLDGAPRDIPAAELASLRDWLPSGRVDQKRLDALEMLVAISRGRSRTEAARRFRFEWTSLWDDFVARSDEGGDGSVALAQAVLEELRIAGTRRLRSSRGAGAPADDGQRHRRGSSGRDFSRAIASDVDRNARHAPPLSARRPR